MRRIISVDLDYAQGLRSVPPAQDRMIAGRAEWTKSRAQKVKTEENS
jgi:hypothetical protein